MESFMVDGRNPKQPPGMYKTLQNSGIDHQLTGAGFLPSTVVQSFWNTTSDMEVLNFTKRCCQSGLSRSR